MQTVKVVILWWGGENGNYTAAVSAALSTGLYTISHIGNGLVSNVQKAATKKLVSFQVLIQIIPKYHVLELLQDANFNEWYRFMIFVYHKIIKNRVTYIESDDTNYIYNSYYNKKMLYPLDNNNSFEFNSVDNTLEVKKIES